ncbi:phosphoribosylpyrophosphate synthetase [Dokdonia sp. Hel_I_53]|uniref:phosphoribosylpyrophosphate synthetase n=1 Tax=Dokdonia sp. Hel_I_53 TaxID=1566287 RepID=UPI00119B0794|nr:phosphoribosylpyrophosphate synthetase [Dokdonia sp. Hel_I_53]TVZ51938.1 hypothetical protein OD90_1100 [Dokdonia sp. Hel_I_53]
MKKGYDTLSLAIEDLQKEGYTEDFNLVDDGIESKNLKKQWNAGEINVTNYFRFEGMTNPGDNSILYVVESKDGTKGLLVDAYGVYDGQISQEMIDKLNVNNFVK